MSKINGVTVTPDRSTVKIGPGNRWGDVYNVLDPQGITITGGRVADVGVGGLATGGGISFYTPKYGLVCDNVVNFQVCPNANFLEFSMC